MEAQSRETFYKKETMETELRLWPWGSLREDRRKNAKEDRAIGVQPEMALDSWSPSREHSPRGVADRAAALRHKMMLSYIWVALDGGQCQWIFGPILRVDWSRIFVLQREKVVCSRSHLWKPNCGYICLLTATLMGRSLRGHPRPLGCLVLFTEMHFSV